MRSAHKPSRQSERNRHMEALLDDALRMTFPASDPIAPALDAQPAGPQGANSHEDVHPSRPNPSR
jgi:hypothetical protein